MAHSKEPITPLSVATRWEDHALVMDITGEVDLLTAPELEKALSSAWEEEPKTLVLDLTQVTFLSSAGLAVLVRSHHLAGDHARFRVVTNSAETLRPMQLMGLDRELAVYPSQEEALAA